MAFDEEIRHEGELLAIIIRSEASPAATRFHTPPELNLQLGFVVYPAGSEIARHSHRRIERSIVGTNEVLLVRKGRCEIDLYGGARELVATRELRAGDVVLLGGGGHGFRVLEDTVFLEVKQGPYYGAEEKEVF